MCLVSFSYKKEKNWVGGAVFLLPTFSAYVLRERGREIKKSNAVYRLNKNGSIFLVGSIAQVRFVPSILLNGENMVPGNDLGGSVGVFGR